MNDLAAQIGKLIGTAVRQIARGTATGFKWLRDLVARKIAEGNARNLEALRRKIETSLTRAKGCETDAVKNAVAAIPDGYQTLEAAQLKMIVANKLPGLIAAIEKEEEFNANFEAREQRYAEVMAALNDEGHIMSIKPGDVMLKEHFTHFGRFIRSAHQAGGNASISDKSFSSYVSEAAKGYPNQVVFSCSIGQMPDQHRHILSLAALMMRHDIVSRIEFDRMMASFVLASSGGRVYELKQSNHEMPILGALTESGDGALAEALSSNLPGYLPHPDRIISDVVNIVDRILKEEPNSPLSNDLSTFRNTGAGWLTTSDLNGSIYSTDTDGEGLILGPLPDESGFLVYAGEGSLFTIAPPGSGKTQCQVMPNLVMYQGPAIVLDIKGECFDQTAGFRSNNIGPVLKFAPTDKAASAHYNPLDFVRSDPEYLASDARKLADMLIVPQSTNDPYWESRGRDILGALIGFVALQDDPNERNMKSVMDLLSPSPAMLEALLEEMRKTGVTTLERTANQIEGMSEKQLSSIFDSARAQLSVWDLGELDAITDRSDWHPKDFKREGPPLTLYLSIGPADIQRFASVLRVIIGQHLDYFMEVLPDNLGLPIVFFLDEAPQLGRFEPLPKASALGRQYGLRLWLFAQNRNQIQTAYPDADTILGNAMVQCWMNPDEIIAAQLEQSLGKTRGLFDGAEKPLVAAHELRGPEYKEKIIVVGRGERPACIRKHFAYNDPFLQERMGLSVAPDDSFAA